MSPNSINVQPTQPKYSLKYIGYNYQEAPTFVIDRPKGSNDFLFLFFSSPVDMEIDNIKIRTQPNAIVLFHPNQGHYYCDVNNGFVNDWFHFKSPLLESYSYQLGIPLNTIFYLDHHDFIRDFIRDLELEYKLKELSYEENINALLTSFFIRLSRAYDQQNSVSTTPYIAGLKEDFRLLRSKILTQYQHNWTTDEMAMQVKLSRSRFCILYKTFFEISPKDDLLTERFKMAKHLLLTTHLTIEEIASRIGYSNIYHFSKQFKRVVGSSPSYFRQTRH